MGLEDKLVFRILAVYETALKLLGGHQEVLRWMATLNLNLDLHTPAEVMETIEGCVRAEWALLKPITTRSADSVE